MATATKSGQNLSFTYNADGLRTTKTVNGVVHTYYYSGSKLVRETYGDYVLDFFYDQNGTPFMLLQNGNIYYYITNAQGDVIRLVDINGNVAASYRYDPYGKATSALGSHANINPLRYRGYVFDHETGLYYLQSRYYDPETGRFINADDYPTTGQGLTGNNMFAYCGNNPIMRADDGGEFWHIVAGAVIGGLIGGISSAVGQAISGQEINWAAVGISAAAGALTGAITAACPAMGAVATGIVHGVVGAGAHVATELVYGRTPTVAGTLAAGITSGVLAGGTRAIANAVSSGRLEIGMIKGVRASQGFPGIRYKTETGPAYSVELHSGHNGHTPHLQVNKWLYQYKGYEGQPYRFRSWHYEFFKPWKGVY